MRNKLQIPISTANFSYQDEVAELVRLLTCPATFEDKVMEERQPDENIKQTFERVEDELQAKTGMRHYSSYASFRVMKCRLQKAKGIGNQLNLFD